MFLNDNITVCLKQRVIEVYLFIKPAGYSTRFGSCLLSVTRLILLVKGGKFLKKLCVASVVSITRYFGSIS